MGFLVPLAEGLHFIHSVQDEEGLALIDMGLHHVLVEAFVRDHGPVISFDEPEHQIQFGGAAHDPDTGKRIIKNVMGKMQAVAAQQNCQVLDVTLTDKYTVTTYLRSYHRLYAQPNIRMATEDRYKLIVETPAFCLPSKAYPRYA